MAFLTYLGDLRARYDGREEPGEGAWMKHRQSKQMWGVLVLATFTGTYLGIWLQQVSLKFTEAGIAQTLFSTSPIFVLPMVVLLGERISFRAALGAFIALAGVGLLFGFT